MKTTPWAVFAALFLAALCALSPMPASAQNQSAGRDNVFMTSGVRVDITAPNAAAAQQQAFASAQRIGFQRLVKRLTSSDEQGRLAMPNPDATTLERMVLSVDVEQERRSGTHYVGRLSVRFDPNQVRALLRQAGFTVIEARTSPVLIVPLATADVSPDVASQWRDAWAQGGYSQELAPLAVAPPDLSGSPDWNSAQPYARSEAAQSAVYATLRMQGGNLSAALTDVSASGNRSRGTVSAQAADPTALPAALASLADQANDQIQNEWKARAGSATPQRSRVSATALYSDERQWERIKQALQGAAATLISEIRIEAVGREGALVSFTFTGRLDQLGAELNRRGVSLEQGAQGPVLRVNATH